MSGIQDILTVLLIHCLVAKINGRKNENNNSKVVIFFVYLAASVNRKAYGFIYGNVNGMNFCQSQKHISQKLFPSIHQFLKGTYC